MLGAAFAAGLCSAGVDVTSVDVVPTGAVSFLVQSGGYGLGAVISASHNPAPDNGIKLLSSEGRKLSETDESCIEELIDAPSSDRPSGADVGVLSSDLAAIEPYMGMLEAIVPERLEGLTVAVDGAHGAAYKLGAEILRRLGAQVHEVGNHPDGMNINAEGGATKPHVVQGFAQSIEADAGLAFDGDADRVVFSDSKGRLVNGDRTMAIWCAHWAKHGGLDPPVVVGTVMSNGGFEAFMRQEGVRLERTMVGDKYVSQRMRELGARIGGEQSGHLIFSEHGVTGDGLITALELLRVLKREGSTLTQLFDSYQAWPQVLVNVTYAGKEALDASDCFRETVSAAEELLGNHGRLNVRPSGTQPMLRVMVEADDVDLRDQVSNMIVQTLQTEVAGEVYSRVDLTHSLGE
jgi:phosphoglucosamine mutase